MLRIEQKITLDSLGEVFVAKTLFGGYNFYQRDAVGAVVAIGYLLPNELNNTNIAIDTLPFLNDYSGN